MHAYRTKCLQPFLSPSFVNKMMQRKIIELLIIATLCYFTRITIIIIIFIRSFDYGYLHNLQLSLCL